MNQLAEGESSSHGGSWSLLAILLLLVLLSWGLLASDRGLHDDDVTHLARAQTRLAEAPLELLQAPRHTPTRKLPLVAFAIATATGSPRLALQAILGAVWLGLGLIAFLVCREVLPERPRIAAAAAVLTVSATGDFYAFSTGSMHYQLSILACFGALLMGLRYCTRGGLHRLLAAPVLINLSVWHIDAGLTTLLLAPILLWVHAGYRVSRRLLEVLTLSAVASVPYAVAFTRFMLDPNSYAAWGVDRPESSLWLRRGLEHLAYNFSPWQWVARPQSFFGWDVEQLLPTWLPLTAAVIGGGAVLYWLKRVPRLGGSGSRASSASRLVVAAIALAMVVAANAMFAVAQLAEYYYRTHLVSRIWAAVFVAILVDLLAQRVSALGWRGCRAVGNWLAPAVAALFVFFGVLGGLERQNFYLASWLLQQKELRSVVEEVPALRDDAVIVLNLPQEVRGLATENTEMARQWAILLYGEPSVAERVFVISHRGGGCRPETGGLRCWHERAVVEKFSQRRVPSWELLVPYDRLILLTYDAGKSRFRLNRRLPLTLRGQDARAADSYEPSKLIEEGPVSGRVRSLLGGGTGIARWLGS